MRRPFPLATVPVAAFALLVQLAAGCGATSGATPVACLDGAGAYLGALGDAPAAVELGGEVPISDCLAENQRGGDLATVGASLVEAATELNRAGREAPAGPDALRLGYLVGAAARGAEETEGIHTDLLRRLDAAARYSPGGARLPAAFRSAYRRGYEAGLARG